MQDKMNQHTRLDGSPIPFIDVAAQRRRLGSAIDDAVARVLAHCQFIPVSYTHLRGLAFHQKD